METKIQIVPLEKKIILPSSGGDVYEDVSEQSITYTQGYGQLSKAGAVVQVGVTGHISIDLEIESLSSDFYKDTTDEIINSCSKSVQKELRQHSDESDYKDWWFAFFAGSSKENHDSNYYKNQQSSSLTSLDTKCYNAVHKRFNSYKQNYKVSGEFDIVGQSYVQTTVYLFIETLTIQTSEGTTLVIPTTNTALADENGNTGAATTKSKITIVPLSTK